MPTAFGFMSHVNSFTSSIFPRIRPYYFSPVPSTPMQTNTATTVPIPDEEITDSDAGDPPIRLFLPDRL